MEPLRFHDGDHYFEEHSGDILAPGTKELPQGTSSRLNKEIVATKCSAYDCEFVALAHANGVRLLTVDREILHEFPEVAISLKQIRARLSFGREPLTPGTGNLYVIAGDTPAATVSALWLTKMLLRPRAKKLPEPTD